VREPSQFTAALAHVSHLAPQEAMQQLQMRVVNLVRGTRVRSRGGVAGRLRCR